MKNIVFILITAIVLVSCKAKTAITPTPTPPPVKVSYKSFFDKLNKKEPFESLKISNIIEANMGSYVPTMNGTFYIENNKKVWANLQVLFVNVARGIATPEGVKAYEKANKTYVDSDFTYLNNILKVNFLNYSALENLLLGKTFIPLNEEQFSFKTLPEGYTLNSINNIEYQQNGKKGEYKAMLQYSQDFLLKTVVLEDIKSRNILEINYNNHEMVGSQKLPKNVKIIIKGNKTGQILIENTKFEFLKMETPFSIPTNYTKTEIK